MIFQSHVWVAAHTHTHTHSRTKKPQSQQNVAFAFAENVFAKLKNGWLGYLLHHGKLC